MSFSWRSTLGPWLVIGGVLLAIAGLLLKLQPQRLQWYYPGTERLIWAGIALFVYVVACVMVRARAGARQQIVSRMVTMDSPNRGAKAQQSPLLIAYASQTGFAEQTARQTAQSLSDAGVAVVVHELNALDAEQLSSYQRALFVVSTTGEGDAPDGAALFASRVMREPAQLVGLHYGLLALGDSEYDNFCGFGQALQQWLQASDATPQFDLIEVDCEDAGALRHWQYHVGLFTGCTDLPDWQRPRYARWQLGARRLLNPGSVGSACFHLELVPLDDSSLRWKAGDVVEIGPSNSPAAVAQLLSALGLAGEALVSVRGKQETLVGVLARHRLPPSDSVHGLSAQALADSLRPLPHRAYSIASIPADGAIHLLVRQMVAADGSLGRGSGWLTEHAAIGGEIALRVRENPGFHAPGDDRPLILIGNGSGLAGLRGLLKQRISQQRQRNWLLFGERHAAHDFFHKEEIETWRTQGWIEHLDLAFSRDQTERIYVQHFLQRQSERLQAWIDAGALIMVCGSLAGMAQDVDATLRQVLGDATVTRLVIEGRYRRDVY